jgi:hypothetical protein
MRSVALFAVLAALIGLTGCAPQQQFYWGSYEESLYSRQQQPGPGGDLKASGMLLSTITEAQSYNAKIPPGVHADYGYLLFKQGQIDEAVAQLQKELALYPESMPFMHTMMERMQARGKQKKGINTLSAP